MTHPAGVTLRALRADDVDDVVDLHATTYAAEYGFDATFADYVRDPLRAFAQQHDGAMWIAERNGRLAGCVAIVFDADGWSRLRWFLVAPVARGGGLGSHLLRTAVAFARDSGVPGVLLWTVSALHDARRLYERAGFTLVEEVPGHMWGTDIVEQRFDLTF